MSAVAREEQRENTAALAEVEPEDLEARNAYGIVRGQVLGLADGLQGGTVRHEISMHSELHWLKD